jgi:hypothetical protein
MGKRGAAIQRKGLFAGFLIGGLAVITSLDLHIGLLKNLGTQLGRRLYNSGTVGSEDGMPFFDTDLENKGGHEKYFSGASLVQGLVILEDSVPVIGILMIPCKPRVESKRVRVLGGPNRGLERIVSWDGLQGRCGEQSVLGFIGVDSLALDILDEIFLLKKMGEEGSNSIVHAR